MSNIVAGQYIIFRQEDEINHLIMKAYDFLAEKGYTLLDITETFAEYDRIHIETTPENIYLCIYKPMGLEIYCVLIQNGKVNLEKLISVINEEQSQK